MSFSFLICYWICATTLITIGALGYAIGYVTLSLRSKRFRRFFPLVRGIFCFLAARKLGRAQHGRKERGFFALAPIFARSKSEKCFKPAESPILRKNLPRRLCDTTLAYLENSVPRNKPVGCGSTWLNFCDIYTLCSGRNQ